MHLDSTQNLLTIQRNYNYDFIETLMQLPMSLCYPGVSKAILDAAGLEVEQELLQMGVFTIHLADEHSCSQNVLIYSLREI